MKLQPAGKPCSCTLYGFDQTSAAIIAEFSGIFQIGLAAFGFK
jgi:hypothetical protein